jgi:cellulose synthase/poly-beta-1,6-N-acetylglucosamine synthase-like glycosyltransferase
MSRSDAEAVATIPRVSILLPAYNEGIALPRLLARIEPAPEQFKVVLYSDGSTDATIPIARDWQQRLSLVILARSGALTGDSCRPMSASASKCRWR